MSSTGTPSPASNPNIFTPPATCFNKTYTISPNGNDALFTTTLPDDPEATMPGTEAFHNLAILFDGFENLDLGCYPLGFGFPSQVTSNRSSTWTDTGVQSTLSPATCPSGYASRAGQVTARNEGGLETAAICCPSGMALNTEPPGTVFDSKAILWQCYLTTGFTYVRSDTTSFVPTYYDTQVYAPQVTVTWRNQDLSLFQPVTTTSSNSSGLISAPSTSSPSATAASPTTSGSAGSGLSTNAEIGIGVGVTLGVLLLLLVVGVIWRKRRRPSEKPLKEESGTHEKPELSGEGIQLPQLASEQVHELHPQPKPGEADDQAARAELEGEWRGWEAPAQ